MKCKICRKEVKATSNRQKYCLICRKIEDEKQNKEWYKRNSEHLIEKNQRWRKENPELNKVRRKKYYKNHSEQIKERMKENYKKNSEYCKKKMKKWYRKNPDKISIYHSKRRKLGYNILNTYFENSVGHHVNNNDVVYIPENIHLSCLAGHSRDFHRQRVLNYYGSLENMIQGNIQGA